MGFQIEDGKGTGVRAAIDSEGHLLVDAIVLTELAHQSDAHGLSFTWTSTHVTSAGDIEFISIRNDADENLHIDNIIWGSSIAQQFTLLEVTGGTPSGSTLTAQNLNLISGVSKTNTAFGSTTVSALTGNILLVARVPASQAVTMDMHDALILGTGDTISVSALVAASVEVSITGFWDED